MEMPGVQPASAATSTTPVAVLVEVPTDAAPTTMTMTTTENDPTAAVATGEDGDNTTLPWIVLGGAVTVGLALAFFPKKRLTTP